MNASLEAPTPSSLVTTRYILLLLACAAALFYFQWRIGVMNPAFPAYSWIVFAAELIGFARALMFLLSAVRVPHRAAVPAPAAGLTVDVLIPTFGEPLEVVRRTILGALAIRYPHETWLLDDGGRAELRALAGELGCHYVARSERSNAKAGNLNHALRVVTAEFVAILDADHVADPRFLDRTLGYFQDDQLAFVQTPHEFFNVDSFDHLNPRRTRSNGASFFHRVVQRGRDASNTTIFVGSAAVFRRRALDDVSGFATDTLSEDVHTSLRLHAAGWHSIFHPEILSAGMSPLDARGYYRQRLRWAQDAIQILLRAKPFSCPGLTRQQRIAYLIHVASNLEGWRHIFIYALPIAILITGIVPLRSDAATFLAHFGPYFIAINLATVELARGLGRPDESAVYNLARCPTALHAVFTAHRESAWFVTRKSRDAVRRGPESLFTLSVLLASLAAIAFASAQLIAGRSPFTPATLAVVGLWAAYNAVTAARLLALERRCARERRANTRFEERLAATLRRNDQPHVAYDVEIVSASAGGFSLRLKDTAMRLRSGAYTGTLESGVQPFAFELDVREANLGGVVRWPSAATRARFDLLLHLRAIERLAATDRGDRGGLLR